MKKTLRNILIITALSPLLSQCASQDEVQRLQYQLHVVNKKLADMQTETVGDIQKRQAASSNQMDQLEREILNLKSQLEETNHLNRSLKEQNKELQTNIGTVAKEEAERRQEALRKIEDEQRKKEAEIADLTERLKIQQESLQSIQDARVRDAERRAKDARAKADAAKANVQTAGSSTSTGGSITHLTPVQGKRVVAASNSQPAMTEKRIEPVKPKQPASSATTQVSQPAQPEPTVAATTPEPVKQATPEPAASSASPLVEADKLYQQKEYGKAYSAYDKIASVDPASDNGITAGYMMGECLFAQQEYDKAILQYQKIISQNGNHPKAASATLKQAMAFERLADNETARMIYKKLVNHYSTSPEAKIAQEKLSTL